MPTKNRFAELQDEITAIRRDIHENPEILFETHRTAALVAEKLKEFGCDEIVTGIGRTGVVGVIRGAHGVPNGGVDSGGVVGKELCHRGTPWLCGVFKARRERICLTSLTRSPSRTTPRDKAANMSRA